MSQPLTEPHHPSPIDPLAEHGFDEDSYGERETTETEHDDDPAAEDDFPAPFGSDPQAD